MKSNGRLRLNTHTKYLKISRKGVPRNLEPLFVYFLRGNEKVCKIFDNEESASKMGVTLEELSSISQNNYDQLYEILFSYFSLVLSGDSIPGTFHERIQTTKEVIGDHYQGKLIEASKGNGNVSGTELWNALSFETAILIQEELNIKNLNIDLLSEFLLEVAIKDVGLKASKLKGKSGCYIATDIYGSYNDPNVILLRNFRDEILEPNYIGKKFIALYYKVSPKILTYDIYRLIFKLPMKIVLTGFIGLLNLIFPNLNR